MAQYEIPHDANATCESEYPDPEISQMQNSGWVGRNQQDLTGGMLSFEVRRNHPTFPNTHSSPSNGSFQRRSHGSPAINDATDEFETPGSRYRSKDRGNSQTADFLDEADSGHLSVDELSDAGSDYIEFHAGLAKLKDDIRDFRATLGTNHHRYGVEDSSSPSKYAGQGSRGRGRSRIGGGGRGRGTFRGPRRAAEPTGDIKLRLSKASEAFIAQKYDDARSIIAEIIRINAETHEAWTLLASIFRELRDTDKALMALMYAAHLRPKHVDAWLSCAEFALEETGTNRSKYLPSAHFCYASAIRANPKDLEARFGKAAVYLEQKNLSSAISEYRTILNRLPHDTRVLRLLAETYIDNGDAETAKGLYKESIAHFRTSSHEAGHSFGWSDVDVYVELYGYLKQYDIAIKEIKSLARWLLGRDVEGFWDAAMGDDREWDADDSRRVQTAAFFSGQFPLSSYGQGLPLELRVKLGLYRLHLGQHDEALLHFNWLDPGDTTGEGRVSKYAHLCRQAADELLEAGFNQDALAFYEPLKQISGQASDASLYVQMGKCFLNEELDLPAEECLQTAIQLDREHIEARMLLARFYEKMNEQEQAFIYVNEVLSLRRRQHHSTSQEENPNGVSSHNAQSFMPSKGPRSSYKPRRLVDPNERLIEERKRAEQLQTQYYTLRRVREHMRHGDEGSTSAWMDAARDLTDDFRGFKTFYPWDKYVRFLGYSGDARLQAETPLDSDLTAMADRLSRSLGADIVDKANIPAVEIPADYRGISFSEWLDIFLEYALCLARKGIAREAYDICEAAKDAIVFYHSREDMFLIHVCWCVCALLANDEETCVTIARFFMKDYQFTTDSYRMFAAVTRLCHSPVSWYSSGPTQKYILRQIKAMDFALVDEGRREKYFSEKGSYSAQDENGRLVINNDMDIALLMLYGHILFTGSSYAYALNYFFRAHTLDPGNPMINLSIGLAYVHHALKRQVENRQHLVLQGLVFLFEYYNCRKRSSNIEERQEAHFNMARTYHTVGLAHLAIPFYSRVLEETTSENGSHLQEEIVIEAACNLQTLHTVAGNHKLADAVTMGWLMI